MSADDLTETLAATLRKWRLRHAEGRAIFWSDQAALLSAVENVLALPERDERPYQTDVGDAFTGGYNGALREVRKALTDALGADHEPSNSGSEQ